MQTVWEKDRDLKAEGFTIQDEDISPALRNTSANIKQAQKVSKLLQIEADLTKRLYKIAANRTKPVEVH